MASRVELALRVKCARCGAHPGARCTYLPPDPRVLAETRSPQILTQGRRAGQPTKRPHNERLRRAYWYGRSKKLAPVTPLSPELRAASTAIQDWARREHAILTEWLDRFGPILWETESDVPWVIAYHGEVMR